VRVHDLRHTAATYLLSLGTHPKKVQELLGHSSILLTLDTYSHVLPSMHQEIAAQMDKLFEAADEESGDGNHLEEAALEGPPNVRRDDLPSVLPSNAQNRN
jgi:hypothetical protein